MKRQLILIRHAKSDWGNPSLSDFDRPLNVRGECDVPVMGERLVSSGVQQVQRIFSSPALRAKRTAESIARSLSFQASDISWVSELYMATPQKILDVIHACPDRVSVLAIVGHNPGISELAALLCGKSLGNIPTCGIVQLSTESVSWSSAERFNLLNFDYPGRNS